MRKDQSLIFPKQSFNKFWHFTKKIKQIGLDETKFFNDINHDIDI